MATQTTDHQRQVFRSQEKYLDPGFGACPLRHPEIAAIIPSEFEALTDLEIAGPHDSIMPNHWHALLVPANPRSLSLSDIMKRLKGRTAKRIRQTIGGSGPFWQCEWFDRWVRDEGAWDRLVKYIQPNAVKAGLVEHWQDHAWTR